MNKLKSLIDKATNIVALTGAGMSTESGLPDFRSITGLYSTVTTAMTFSSWLFKLWPSHFYKVMGPFYKELKEAKPNAGHIALAELEKCGKKVQIITQNVDGLHQAAGSTTVHEIHGKLGTMTCLKCKRMHDTEDFTETLTKGKTPRCRSCGGVLKPDLVFFGDNLPEEAFRKAKLAMLDADLVLVCGTSLKVSPANQLPGYRVEGTPLVIINRDPTPWDSSAKLVIHASIGEVLSRTIK
ncbi:MAG: NAD-dependent protein deacylase [Victivallales bacterium]|nr:NAD-dependent protein deacylase [Victivallales bacterium]